MAFGVTGKPFDTRTIPESYLMLRKVARLPFGASFLEPEKTAAVLMMNSPVALVENDCVIATGSSLINAFDRLEVAEFSAKAVISAGGLGEMVMIGEKEIADIDRAFDL
jgi:L-fuculose-phosphate aldolase